MEKIELYLVNNPSSLQKFSINSDYFKFNIKAKRSFIFGIACAISELGRDDVILDFALVKKGEYIPLYNYCSDFDEFSFYKKELKDNKSFNLKYFIKTIKGKKDIYPYIIQFDDKDFILGFISLLKFYNIKLDSIILSSNYDYENLTPLQFK